MLVTGGDEPRHAGDAAVHDLRVRGVDERARRAASHLPARQRLAHAHGVCFRHHRHTAAAAAAATAEAAHTVTRRAETLSECTNVSVRTASRFPCFACVVQQVPVLRLRGAACLQASPPAWCIRNKVEATRAPELHESGYRICTYGLVDQVTVIGAPSGDW